MKRKAPKKAGKASKAQLKNLAPARTNQIKAGRTAAQINTRSVNPIVISRDRAQNS